MPGYVDRFNDYRGLNPFYRAGSVLNDTHSGAHPSVTGDVYNNAGDYGITSPVIMHQESAPRPFDQDPISVPQQGLESGGFIVDPHTDTPGVLTPDRQSIQDLLSRPLGTIQNTTPGTLPDSLPSTQMPPPTIPRAAPLPFDGAPSGTVPESMPFVPIPGDGIESLPFPPIPATPPNILETELPFTLEDLKRLDPSVQDLQIISIEDAAVRR
ncbi:MAG: hypothetical protein FWG73_04395 [Planctomycetaceae bacterium]|nr:hypothetical protein [Planctomycetaceae bacterium]